MNQYKTLIKKVGEKLCVEPALIAGIISRESHAGTILKNGWGDNGNGFGLMQVFADTPLKHDKNQHINKSEPPKHIINYSREMTSFWFDISRLTKTHTNLWDDGTAKLILCRAQKYLSR